MIKVLKSKKPITGFLFGILIVICVSFCAINTSNLTAYAKETGRSDDVALISGYNNYKDPFNTCLSSDLTEKNYISNFDYFLINPQHAVNDGSDNAGGTCTTVAMQMLLGYHNYYSDRNIIPETKSNGVRFLHANYGNLEYNPKFNRNPVGDSRINGQIVQRGCEYIGTSDAVYNEIFDLTWISDWYGIGQAVGLVKDGAIRFISEYSDPLIKDSISLASGIFSKSTAQSDIDVDRPIVLGMHPFNEEGSFHVVLAYGYAKLDGVDGFLVHYGWGAGATQVWVPASWFAFQIRMSVDTEQNFVDTGNNIIPNGESCATHRELYCENTGVSTVEPLYATNEAGNEIIDVNYPLSGEIEVPRNLNGVNITSIGDSAFSNQANITSVTLPNLITNIGNGAFENCYSLTEIYGYDYVVSIGDYAFNECHVLNLFTLTVALTNIGRGAFLECDVLQLQMAGTSNYFALQSNILYNSDYTKIIWAGKTYENITIPESVTEIEPYAFAYNDRLECLTISNQLNIGEYAFTDCSSLMEVNIDSYIVPTMGIRAFANNDFTLYVPHSSYLLYCDEFAEYTNSIEFKDITVTFVKNSVPIYTFDTYYGAIISDIFETSKSGYTFVGWNDDPTFDGKSYANGGLWGRKENFNLYAEFVAKEYTIDFQGEGTDNIADKIVVYDEQIGELPVVTKSGYTQYGWKDLYGDFYEAQDIWQGLGDIIVEPYFIANIYTITYDGNKGVSSASSKNVAYNAEIGSLATATRNGYMFVGWNTKKDGAGENIYEADRYLFEDDIILFAQYTPKEYSIMFNKCGGTGGSTGVDAVFGEPLSSNLTAPTFEGYSFNGYYLAEDGKSVQYYNSDMESSANWNIAVEDNDSIELYAYWIPNVYDMTLCVKFDDEILSESSLDTSYIYFTAASNDTLTITTSHDTGDPYLCLYDADYNILASNDDGNGSHDAKISYNVINENNYIVGVRAYNSLQMIGKVHCSGAAYVYSYPYEKYEVTYNSSIPYNEGLDCPFRDGYNFEGYYSEINGNGCKYLDSEMRSVHVWDIANNATLYPHWTPNIYTVDLDMQGGSGNPNNIQVVYGNSMPENSFTPPTKTGYYFQGYYSQEDGLGTKYYDSDMSSASQWNRTAGGRIFAYWAIIDYNITYTLNGGIQNGTINPLKYTVEDNIIFNEPTKTGYLFTGWYDEGQLITKINEGTIGNKNLIAVWEVETYNIIYKNLMSNMIVYTDTYTYGEGLNAMPNLYQEGYRGYSPVEYFYGWYTSDRFTTKVTYISTTRTGDITLYAKYDYHATGFVSGSAKSVTDGPISSQPSIRIFVGLDDHYAYIANTTLEKIKISISITLWEVYDGIQYIYIYDGNDKVDTYDINHGGSATSTTKKTYDVDFILDICDYQDISYLDLKFGAGGLWADTWQYDDIEVNVFYTN